MRKINKQQMVDVTDVTENVRQTLILKSFKKKIPKEMLECNQQSELKTNINRTSKTSVRFDKNLTTPKRSE